MNLIKISWTAVQQGGAIGFPAPSRAADDAESRALLCGGGGRGWQARFLPRDWEYTKLYGKEVYNPLQ